MNNSITEPFDTIDSLQQAQCMLLNESEIIQCAKDDMHKWLFHCDEFPTIDDVLEIGAHFAQVYSDNHYSSPGEYALRDYLSDYATDYINSMRKTNPYVNNKETDL